MRDQGIVDIRESAAELRKPGHGEKYWRSSSTPYERGTVFRENWGFSSLVETLDSGETTLRFRLGLRRMMKEEEDLLRIMSE